MLKSPEKTKHKKIFLNFSGSEMDSAAREFSFSKIKIIQNKNMKNIFFPPRRCCWKSERERTERIKYFWFWQKIVIMYDNNILIFLFLHFYFVPGNWSGSFRLNDFDRWQEKGSTSPAHLFSDLRLLCENFSIWHLSNSKHLFCLFYFWEEVLLIE